jgi:hypothetical protein
MSEVFGPTSERSEPQPSLRGPSSKKKKKEPPPKKKEKKTPLI